MPRDINFERIAKSARIPRRYWRAKAWRKYTPSWATSSMEVLPNIFPEVDDHTQAEWMEQLIQDPSLFRLPSLLCVLGNNLHQYAQDVGFGLATLAIENGFRTQCYHPGKFRFEVPHPDHDLNVAVLYGIHSDDAQHRRQLVRDFVSDAWSETVFRIVCVSGEKPLDYIYRQGMMPDAILSFPVTLKTPRGLRRKR